MSNKIGTTEPSAIYIGKNGIDYSAMQGPCSTGYHIPSNNEWGAVYNIWTALGGGANDGTNFGIALKLPFAGRRSYSSASVNSQGIIARYWSSTAYGAGSTYSLGFDSSGVFPQNGSNRSYGYSVRCFKDSTVVPDNAWIKLYGTSIEAGGIFWSSNLGLISMSSDGTTWITMADKNLGATTVYNDGDTLSQANCGNYYQRGNNYGFPWTGIVITSSTQVDTTDYGPGNYYSSSTFIIASGDRSNPSNDNLRGGDTGAVPGIIPIPVSEVYVGSTKVRPVWQPGANTYGYYTFDDQDANQITDFSGNNRNLTGGTMPTYTLVSGTNYAGDYDNISSGMVPSASFATLSGNFTMLVWVKPTVNSPSYVNCIRGGTDESNNHQISIIRGYNGWDFTIGQFEYYDYISNGGTPITKRTAIMSGVSTNTWHLVCYTYNNGAVQTYADGVASNSITGNTSNYVKTFRLGSSNVGGAERFKGQIGECIVENKIRTAQEISDYYNQTKGNYGL